MRRHALRGALAVAGLAAAAGVWSQPAPAAGVPSLARAQASTFAAERPNVVVVLADDLETTSFEVMAQVDRQIADEGVTFSDSFASFPLCCPSRATLLTGQYAHNHGVVHNNPPTGGFARLDSTNTLPLWLQGAGYYTAHVGKYLNFYEQTPELVPPGWDGWWTATGCGSCRPVDRLQHVYRYYGYRLNENGALVDYGNEVGDYQTDVFTRRVEQIIRERAPLEQPFFISFDPVAPHGGLPQPSPQPPFDCTGGQVALPAARHAAAFDDVPLPRTPSFNEEDVSDKPASIQQMPSLSEATQAEMTTRYRCRLESLLALDEGVARIIEALRETNELDNTYVIFTSDNGYFFGQHRIPMEKILLYEESIRVPLVMRGPGIAPATRSEEMVVNADLAPTIVQAAGARPARTMDGRSLLPIAHRPERQRGRELLLETIGAAGIRNSRYAYFEHDRGERELYDLEKDPYQLHSRQSDPAYAEVAESLAGRLEVLRSCSGAGCSQLPVLSLRPRPGPQRACLGRDVLARIKGPSLADVDRVELRLGGERLGVVGEPPFELPVPRRALPSRGGVLLRAVAELSDGRRWTREARIRACAQA